MFDRPRLSLKRRSFMMLGFFSLLDLVMMGRLVMIQGIQSADLRARAKDSHFRGIPLAPVRGPILDRNGRPLAETYNTYSVYAVPIQTRKQALQEAVLLASLLGLSQEQILRRLQQRQGFVWIKRRITPQQRDALKAQAAALPGVNLVAEATRYYPNAALAGPVLGFTGVDNQGLSGLEMVYDKQLKGTPGAIEQEFNVAGYPIPDSKAVVHPPGVGDTLELSLDENIQSIAERACTEALVNTGAKRVSITVMNVETGGILALAQTPAFDPNRYQSYPSKDYRVWAVSDTIPPGSIFKPVTVASALESGAVSTGSGFYCPGFKIVLGRRVNCWRLGGHGAESLSDIVKNSCNVGFMDLGLRLGTSRFYSYLQQFGISTRTGVDLPGEAVGIRPPMRRVTALDLAIMAFGQTLTVTPVGLLNAVSAIANGGELMVPHVARKVVKPDGTVMESLDKRVVRRVVRPEVASLVQRMMVRVVDEGSGKMARIPGYRIAGKTGTAQKVIGGRVVQGVYIGSFIGFAPVPNPKVSILVSVDEPQGAFYGGQVAAPVFGRVMTQVLKYLKIPPNVPMKRVPRGQQMVPNLVNLDMDQARQSAQAYGFPLQFTGQGSRVVGQSIEYGAWRPAGTALTATLGNQRVDYLQWVTVPDFRGLDASSSAHLAFNLGMNTQPTGVLGGRVISQSIAAGTEVKSGSTIGIRLG